MEQIALINPENVSKSEASNYRLREAARAIIFDDQNQIALLHATKNHYYKLPGGGIETGEDRCNALKRECKEEIGCEIEIIGELGFVVEYRKKYELKQISYCYTAKLSGEKGVPDLTESEIAEGFETVWVPYEEAKKLVSESNPTVYEGMYMVPRDAVILAVAVDFLE
jgi:8-oxo-dGTP pyrophosphatase MutT (NUDIX family)